MPARPRRARPRDGCVVSGRLSRLSSRGTRRRTEKVLIEDWCQQFPSHSIGTLAFGADGALYVERRRRRQLQLRRLRTDGQPAQPVRGSAGRVGGTQTLPTAEGGSLRSQDLRTRRRPGQRSTARSSASIPTTGAALPATRSPAAPTPNARAHHRLRASAIRSGSPSGPARTRSGSATSAGATWEEIDRIADADRRRRRRTSAGRAIEGGGRAAGLRRRRTSPCARTSTRRHRRGHRAVLGLPPRRPGRHGETLPDRQLVDLGPRVLPSGGNYPGDLRRRAVLRRLLAATASGRCPAPTACPNPGSQSTFVAGAASPVDLKIGPGGDLFYADFNGGTIRRIRTRRRTSRRPRSRPRTPRRAGAADGQLRRQRLERSRTATR